MHQANTLSYATEQSGYVVVPPNTNGMLPKFFRLTSIARFPARNGKGVWNEATVHYDTATLNVGWPSATVDIRLTRGSIVTIQFDRRRMALPDRFSVKKIQLIDEPVAGLNLFELVPASWIDDRDLASRAARLWNRLDRPCAHLLNAVLWDGHRFCRYLSSPVSLAEDPVPVSTNFRYSVSLAEQALLLAGDLRDIDRNVLVVAALLRDAGKADGFRLLPDGGLDLTARGRWIGYQQTVLEWLALARRDVVIADESYFRLVHVLMVLANPAIVPISIEAAILNSAASFVDSPVRFRGMETEKTVMPFAPK
jgi:3'-5' exoribonuclease